MKHFVIFIMAIIFVSCSSQDTIYVFGDTENDLAVQLKSEGYNIIICNTPEEAVDKAPEGGSVMILSSGYPETTTIISSEIEKEIKSKNIRCYAEFVSAVGDSVISSKPEELHLERAVVSSNILGGELYPCTILGLNHSFILPVKGCPALIVTAKVIGFDRAELGLDETPVNPLLFFFNDNILLASSKLSGFASQRFTPEKLWNQTFEYITGWVTHSEKTPKFKNRLSYVQPMYDSVHPLTAEERRKSIEKGIEWFYNGHFFLSEESKPVFDKYETSYAYGPALVSDTKDGDGSMGVLEGHGSVIRYDGKQDYRYWLRNDVQGEVAFAMSVAGKYLNKPEYMKVAENITNMSFDLFTRGSRRDKSNPNYGLMSWINLYPNIYYGDDNARALLGYIMTEKFVQNEEWRRKITECIIANFRTSSVQGYRGSPGMLEEDITRNGWRHYYESDYVNPHPHFESWIWACYLWLYDKTKYEPLLEKARKGIQTTMAAYPGKWHWTNGIQQERARMILPLAWLQRVEPTEEHKKWLTTMIDDLLKSQVECGAIREQMGDPSLNFVGEAKTNDDYGRYEASLIYKNGDPVSDMLYTTNFAFFALNEAVALTDNPQYKISLEKMRDFLVRIQVSSDKFKDVDGAWFRGFNFENWDYWADNADNGWGAWCTLTGWIQSWIVGTQVMIDMNTTYWDMTSDSKVGECIDEVVKECL